MQRRDFAAPCPARNGLYHSLPVGGGGEEGQRQRRSSYLRGLAATRPPPPARGVAPSCRQARGLRGRAATLPASLPPPGSVAAPPRPPCCGGGSGGGSGGGRGLRSMHGAKQHPADGHPGQWVLIAPGNPAGLRGGTGSAAAPISRSPPRPADWPWRCSPSSRRGWAVARAGDTGAFLWGLGQVTGLLCAASPSPGVVRTLWDTGLHKALQSTSLSPLQGPCFPHCILVLCVIRVFQRSASPPGLQTAFWALGRGAVEERSCQRSPWWSLTIVSLLLAAHLASIPLVHSCIFWRKRFSALSLSFKTKCLETVSPKPEWNLLGSSSFTG